MAGNKAPQSERGRRALIESVRRGFSRPGPGQGGAASGHRPGRSSWPAVGLGRGPSAAPAAAPRRRREQSPRCPTAAAGPAAPAPRSPCPEGTALAGPPGSAPAAAAQSGPGGGGGGGGAGGAGGAQVARLRCGPAATAGRSCHGHGRSAPPRRERCRDTRTQRPPPPRVSGAWARTGRGGPGQPLRRRGGHVPVNNDHIVKWKTDSRLPPKRPLPPDVLNKNRWGKTAERQENRVRAGKDAG